MVTMMAEDPARWQTPEPVGVRWFAMSERNLARLVVRETGLELRQLAPSAAADPRAAAA